MCTTNVPNTQHSNMFTTNLPMFYHKNRTPINMTHFTSEKKHTKTTKGINLHGESITYMYTLTGDLSWI